MESRKAPVDQLREGLLSGLFGRVVLVFGIIAPAIVAVLRSLPHSDVAWYLYLARRVTEGARLYVDAVETNPPLVVWLNIPVVKLSQLTEILDFHVLFAVGILVSLGSLALCNAWLKDALPGAPESGRRFLVATLAFAFLVLSLGSFGQREHIMIVTTIPYLLASVARAGGAEVSRRRAIVTGAAAGVGLALKPHFLAVLVSIDGLTWLASRKNGRQSRSESVTAYAVLLSYGLIVVAFASEYFDLARSLLLPFYLDSDAMAWSDLLGAWPIRWGVVALAVTAIVRIPLQYRGLRLFVATELVVMILIALVQRKGFTYHFFPAAALTLLLFGVTLAALTASSRHSSPRRGGRLGSLIALHALVIMVALSVTVALKPIRRPETDSQLRGLLPLVAQYAAGGNILILSNEPHGFPLVNASGVDWSSKFYFSWGLPGMLSHRDLSNGLPERSRSGTASDAEQWFLTGLVDGMWSQPPELLAVDSKGWIDVTSGETLRFVDVLSSDSRFVRLFSRYSYLSSVTNLCVYILDGTKEQEGEPGLRCP